MPTSEEKGQPDFGPSREGVLGFWPTASPDPEPAEDADPLDVAELEAFARSADAPEDLRIVQKRIDSGLYTWEDVEAGRVNDPVLRRLLEDIERRIPYRAFGRWADHGRSWDDIKDEAGRLFRGESGKDDDPVPGLLFAGQQKERRFDREAVKNTE